jgi:putative DNA primase/helicase
MTTEFVPPDSRLNEKVKVLKLNGSGQHDGKPGSGSASNDAPGSEQPQQDRGRSSRSTLLTTTAADVVPEKIEWVWPKRIARGKHTTIAGDPGAGKSQVMISIIATVTTGGDFPCGEGKAPVGNVVIFAAEDGVADTIVPRLLAAGADLTRVHVVTAVRDGSGTRMFNLQVDLEALAEKIRTVGNVVLVCIDPISSYLGKVDSHKNAELRAVLEPVGRMAERTGVAVLSITHFSKGAPGASKKALYRFIGSIAFTAAPRAAFVVLEDPDDKARRLFLHGKNNLANPAQGLAFYLAQAAVDDEAQIIASHVVWGTQPVSTTADDAIQTNGKREVTATDDAVQFLRDALAHGPVAVLDLQENARAAGYLKPEQLISQSKPFRSARAALGVKPYQAKGSKSGGWFWALPEHQVTSDSSDAFKNGRASDGTVGI